MRFDPEGIVKTPIKVFAQGGKLECENTQTSRFNVPKNSRKVSPEIVRIGRVGTRSILKDAAQDQKKTVFIAFQHGWYDPGKLYGLMNSSSSLGSLTTPSRPTSAGLLP